MGDDPRARAVTAEARPSGCAARPLRYAPSVSRARIAAAAALAIAATALAPACHESGGASPVLQPDDLQENDGGSFDPNEILDPDSMQDQQALDESSIEQFLQHTPYGPPSFLATYASHGLTAAAAVAQVAQKYALNPLVLLVRAEMDQGLLGAQYYPAPPSRVEYAFGCGCSAPGQCDADYAGFDVQVDCLGAALRASLEQIRAGGTTDGGWGPNVTSTTLDDQQVTPADASTAALYQYTPLVAVGQPGGNWLFWNIWQNYANALGYAPPPSGTTGPSAWIGDACASDGQCVYGDTKGTCDTQFPQGLCTLECTMNCPSAMNEAPTFCAAFQQSGYCLAVCNPNVPECRAGYVCKSVAQYGDPTTTQYVCVAN